jgi:hypothetical protein
MSFWRCCTDDNVREAVKCFTKAIEADPNRAAALTALERPQEARKLVKEALANNPRLTISRFMFTERYRDLAKRRELQRRLEEAGLPGS